MTETTVAAPSNLAIAQDRRAPIERRLDSVRKLMVANQDKIAAGIAGVLTPQRAIQVACSSIRKNPSLLDCTPASLFGAIAEAATYGWACDGITGHASLVPFNNRQKNCKEVVLIPGYKGLRDLIRRSGECETYMAAVHEGDQFEFRGPFEPPVHHPSAVADRRYSCPVAGAYVLGRWNTGAVKCFYWQVEECMAHRDRYSQGWKRVVGKAAEKDSPWNPANIHEFSVMCCKTVLLDAVHRGEFPLSVEDQSLARRETSIAKVDEMTIDAALPEDLDDKTPVPTDESSAPDDAPPDEDKHKSEATADQAAGDAAEQQPAEASPPESSQEAAGESQGDDGPYVDEPGAKRLAVLEADLEACQEIAAARNMRITAVTAATTQFEKIRVHEMVDKRIAKIRKSRGGKESDGGGTTD